MADITKSGGDILQIRELIFGEQIREYDRRFEDVEKRFKKFIQQMDDHIASNDKLFAEVRSEQAQIEKAFNEKISRTDSELKDVVEQLKSDLMGKIDQLVSDKADRLQLGNALIEMGMKLKGDNLLQQLLANKESGSNG